MHDGTHEDEPFVFLYGCGGTKQAFPRGAPAAAHAARGGLPNMPQQGQYTTGFALGKTPTMSGTLRARILQVKARQCDPQARDVRRATCSVQHQRNQHDRRTTYNVHQPPRNTVPYEIRQCDAPLEGRADP